MKKVMICVVLVLILAGCGTLPTGVTVMPLSAPTPGPTPTLMTEEARIPSFDHVVMIMFENRDYGQVIGNQTMPTFNKLAAQNVLLTRYYAVAHPSLPNYIALLGGNTFGITSDCTDCFINQPSLPDLIEASGRTWKTYQEDLPSPCFVGNSKPYVQKHNPFIYFDPIRIDAGRCKNSVVSLTDLGQDLSNNQLPNFVFIMPNLCNSAHDCSLDIADQWLGKMMAKLQTSSALGQNYLIYVAFEEGSKDSSSCCGLPAKAGGKVAAILISPAAKSGYQDETPLSHYSFLKTLSIAWKLPALGYANDPATAAITLPWK